ncbi:hypothetical protein V8E52_008689 [Russula decolorans]
MAFSGLEAWNLDADELERVVEDMETRSAGHDGARPVAQNHENLKYYSEVNPTANKELDAHPPHITVELPVYKESLVQTIASSVMSIKKAMQTYARQGGTSSIFVHDDGLQLLPESDREERIRFYADHGIGWVARPKHDDSEGGLKRRGRFKKANNMNYGLALSLKIEEIIRRIEIERGEKASLADSPASSDDDGGEDIEEQALRLTVEEIYDESGGRFKPWAHNTKHGRVRLSQRPTVSATPLASLQNAPKSDVMQVAHHYFENGIAHFTRRINK